MTDPEMVWVCEQEESTLHSKLKAISTTGTFTLSPVTAAALSGAFLPGLLPQAWAGQSKIRYVSPNQACICVSHCMGLCICSHEQWGLFMGPWCHVMSAQPSEISMPGRAEVQAKVGGEGE